MTDDRFTDQPPPPPRRELGRPTADEIAEWLDWYRQKFGIEPDETDRKALEDLADNYQPESR